MQRYKIIAIVVVVVVVIAAAAVAVSSRDSDAESTEISLISGLEGVGSGFYYKEGVIDPTELLVYNDDGTLATHNVNGVGEIVIFKPAGWAGLTFGVPTVGSIQYYQLKTIVEVYLNDTTYTDGTTASLKLVAGSPSGNQVGYTVTQGAAARIIESNPDIGITWEPQFSALVVDGNSTAPYAKLVTTDLLFPHATCCVLYGNAAYIEDHPDVAQKLVWAVKNATDWLNAVFDEITAYNQSIGSEEGKWVIDESSEAQRTLVELTNKYTGGTSNGLTTAQILNAFNYVEYAWGDEVVNNGNVNASNPLSKIKSDIASQTDILYDIGGLANYSLSDLGFSNSTQFAEKFVDDEPLKEVLDRTSWDTTEKTRITFSVIVNDMHQLPTHLADEALPDLARYVGNPSLSSTTSLYDQAGLDVEFNGGVSGATAVITQLNSHQAEFGVAAQPAVILYDINNQQTKA